MSVDEGIEQIFNAIGTARMANTIVLFVGDNGLQRGEQRLMGKNIGYPGSLSVSFMARWDTHIDAGSTPVGMVTTADITKTALDAAGASMPNIDGEFFGSRTSGILVEGMADVAGEHPGWIGWRTQNWLYLNYGTGQGEELYKTICDKHAITNVASQYPDKVVELRQKAIAAAQPLPPGFSL
jgi:arylsulfatase A-like enzyme